MELLGWSRGQHAGAEARNGLAIYESTLQSSLLGSGWGVCFMTMAGYAQESIQLERTCRNQPGITKLGGEARMVASDSACNRHNGGRGRCCNEVAANSRLLFMRPLFMARTVVARRRSQTNFGYICNPLCGELNGQTVGIPWTLGFREHL